MEDNGADGGTDGYESLREEILKETDLFRLDTLRKQAINRGFFGLAGVACSRQMSSGSGL